MERRELFKIIGAGVIAENAGAFQHQHAAASGLGAANYKPRFFSEAQSFVVDRLADIIIPTDEHSPGAHDANVLRYIDLFAAYSDAGTKAQWRKWVDLVEAEANQRFGKTFRECSREQHEQIVAAMAEDEGQRTDELGLFFVRLKRLTIDGYHFSPVGLEKDIGYKGVPTREFPGCTHHEHKS